MTKRIFALILALLMTATLFAACKKKDSLIGAWKNDDNDMQLIYIFDSNGEGLVASEAEALAFTWSTEGNTLRITIDDTTSVSTYSIADDVLTISNNTESISYTKIQ